ncbi:MAG TPA: chemotaxis protein CheB [Steroidobacteraceae bacterium]|nr:chemotaxis protein CheB [Steroidobacteraceae bacterium]
MPEEAAGTTREPARDVAVIGASSGGVESLQGLMRSLPADHRGAVCVVLHLSAETKSMLPSILRRAGPLPAVAAEDGMPLEFGRIHVAPNDCHLLVEGPSLRVVHGPKENRHRPAIDPLFRSAAWSFGPRVVGVVLSGNLDDGTAGLWAVKSCGGTTVVQEPNEALHPEMPTNALMHNRIDHRLPLQQIGALLARLAREPINGAVVPTADPQVRSEVDFAELGGDPEEMFRLGALSPYTCPSCRGALWEIEQGGHLRYRCHVGHAYSQGTLSLEQDVAIETSLYTALRAVDEKAMSLRRLAARWPDPASSVRREYEARAGELEQTAEQLRQLLAGNVSRVGSGPTA